MQESKLPERLVEVELDRVWDKDLETVLTRIGFMVSIKINKKKNQCLVLRNLVGKLQCLQMKVGTKIFRNSSNTKS